jgi:UDP-2,3-diacylglucosamine pyrophosphatase LpxH
MRNGIVVSDLHMFSPRSRAHDLLENIYVAAEGAEVLVLNGDIFDFGGTGLASISDTVAEAMNWLQALVSRFPDKQIYYLLGNHDYHKQFLDVVVPWAELESRFALQEYFLRLGNTLFVHGDCVNYKMTAAHLQKSRQVWLHDRKKHGTFHRGVEWADSLGATRAAHRMFFRRHKVVERLLHYINDLHPGIVEEIDHVYFGHTHLAFTDFEHEGIYFHNTGSAINRREFNMLTFQFADEEPQRT